MSDAPLTAAELRVLELLPTASYPQITATLYISLNTVKTHIRKIYLKLGVASRSEAIERAVDSPGSTGRPRLPNIPSARSHAGPC